MYDPEPLSQHSQTTERSLTTPTNKVLESGAWTQSIIWSPRAPFRDFTQLEFNHEDDVVPEERTGMCYLLQRIDIVVTYCVKIRQGLGSVPDWMLGSATSST